MTYETFDLSVFIVDEVSIIDHALRTKSGVESWFLKRADFVDDQSVARQPFETCGSGDAYWWEWFEGTIEQGTIITSEQGRLEFTFGQDVTVMIDYEAIADGTLVKLSQVHDIRDPELKQRAYTSCLQAWTFYLANLKAYVEHGIDLREKAPTRRDHINV